MAFLSVCVCACEYVGAAGREDDKAVSVEGSL